MDINFITTGDANLILRYLCQTGFGHKGLLEKLKSHRSFEPIMAILEKADICMNNPGCYDLSSGQISALSKMPHAIEQIQLKAIHEKEGSYSVALNHLLNEIHARCWECDDAKNQKSYKDYDANDVRGILRKTKPFP